MLTHGIDLAEPQTIATDLLRYGHPLQALHNVSMLLRFLSSFDRRSLETSRSRGEIWRKEMSLVFRELKGARGIRKARAVLAAADPGLESPAESIVAWALKCILPNPSDLVTQYRVPKGDGWIYIDLALPKHKVGVEVSGYGKFGDTSGSARGVARDFMARQRSLEENGWRILNITYEEAKHLKSLQITLEAAMDRFGIPTCVPDKPLWEPTTPELFSTERRFQISKQGADSRTQILIPEERRF